MHTKLSRALLIAAVVFLSAIGAPTARPSSAATPSTELGDVSLQFIENIGQFDERARFQVRGGPATMWLAEDALWLTLAERIEPSESLAVQTRQFANLQLVNLKLTFKDANPHPRIEPFNRLDSVVHYYRGRDPDRWRTDAPVWGGVRYVDLYPGLDLEITGEGGRLAWRLVCRADCASILQQTRLRVEGSEAVTAKDGYLRLTTDVGELALPLLGVPGKIPEDRPAAVRKTDGMFEVTSPFSAFASDDTVSAQASYPEEAYFGSYLGGSSHDWPRDIALTGQGDILDRGDDSRSIWVVGWTASGDFPTEPGNTLSGSSDAFVTKMKRDAVWVDPTFSAYIGGSDEDAAQGIATDADGNVYVTGWTKSDDFATMNAYDQGYNGAVDAFVLKMDSAGALQYASYLGGDSGVDDAAAIAVDAQGVVYLTGYTHSENFPTTDRAYDREFSNPSIGLNDDTFVVKLDLSEGVNGLLYGTFIGGGAPSRGQDIAVDDAGVVYVTGRTGDNFFGPSTENDFPTTPGAFDTQPLPGYDVEAFLFRLNPAGNGEDDLLYSTFLGAEESEEYGHSVAIDAAGQVYLSGETDSPDFPTTGGALDTTCGTDGDCNSRTDFFVSKLSPAGNGAADLLYSTFLGGNYWEGSGWGASDLALGSSGDVYVTGNTSSDVGFPITADAYDSAGDSLWGDVFVVRLRPQGNGDDDLIYGTYVGGSGHDDGETAIALDEEDRVYVAGETDSTDFPTTDHAPYDWHRGEDDAFVFRLLAPPAPDLSSSTKTVVPDTAAAGQVVTFTVQLVNSGTLSATVTVTDTLPEALMFHGTPTASSGDAPVTSTHTLTWTGTVADGATVDITYATMLTSTSTLTPTAVNEAQIDDGVGNVYTRRAFVNGHSVFLPLVLRNQ